jgi:hypothetical protein
LPNAHTASATSPHNAIKASTRSPVARSNICPAKTQPRPLGVDRRAGTAAAAAAPEQSDTAIVVRRLGEHWRKGEQRAIHRRPYVRRKPVTARPSMLDPHIPSIEEWLATAPHLSAVDILVRLGEYVPDRFGKRQLRTVQRLVKKWRAKAAHQLISSRPVPGRTDRWRRCSPAENSPTTRIERFSGDAGGVGTRR